MSEQSNGRLAEVSIMLAKKPGSETVFPDAEIERIHEPELSLLERRYKAFRLASDLLAGNRGPGVRMPVGREPRGFPFVNTVILHECELLTSTVRGWIFGEEITIHFLFLTPSGYFVEYRVVVGDTTPETETSMPIPFLTTSDMTLQVWKADLILITDDEAARWFMLKPESAPECLRSLVEKFDLTAAPAPRPELLAAPPADRPKLVATAAPSGNGDAATNESRTTKSLGVDRQIVEILRSVDHRLTKSAFLDEYERRDRENKLDYTWSDQTVVNALARLNSKGVIDNRRDTKGRGYGLPDWKEGGPELDKPV